MILKSLPLVLISLAFTCPVSAQVIPDRSLGSENSIVTPNITIKDTTADLIEGGAIRGNNLFHSFSEFNVGNGSNVYFANPDGITNILNRVTGNNVSNIFGTLGVDGGANLFLLNPNGIVFGENAALNVSGSFFATTADSYIFGEGETSFSATNPDRAPLLNINLNPGLQMGKNSGSIEVQGNGYSLTGGGTNLPINVNNTATRFQVQPGETLGLIGTDINFTGGIIRTEGGNIQLASVKQGKVELNNTGTWQLDTSQVETFGDIKLINRSLLDTSGFITGDITLQAKDITFENASTAIIQNIGDRQAEPLAHRTGKITINATDLLKISGSMRSAPDLTTPSRTQTGVVYSRLTTETLAGKTAGNIFITASNLSVSDGGFIGSRTYSNADAGNVDIDVKQLIEIKDYSSFSPDFFSSIISTATFSSGNAGKLNISAENISIFNAGLISSVSFGSGQAGEVEVNVAKNLIVDGINPITSAPSNIGSTAFSQGNSGSVNINTARLTVSNRGAINTSTFASGSAGQLTINASEFIKITSPNDRDPRFSFSNSAISSDVRIIAPVFRKQLGLEDLPRGNSGNIILNTPTLTISDGAEVSVSNRGLGNSGNLQINAERVFLDSQAKINAFSASGKGGNIELNISDSLVLRNGSAITAENRGAFVNDRFSVNGGNITIDADTLTLLENSQINANAFEGNGGKIDIMTQGYFVSPDSSISASSELGLDGMVEIDEVSSDRQFQLDRLPEKITDLTNLITVTCLADDNNSVAVVGNGGIAKSPYQTQSLDTTWNDLRPVKQQQRQIAASPKPVEEANSTVINASGELELVAFTASSSDRWIDSSCSN